MKVTYVGILQAPDSSIKYHHRLCQRKCGHNCNRVNVNATGARKGTNVPSSAEIITLGWPIRNLCHLVIIVRSDGGEQNHHLGSHYSEGLPASYFVPLAPHLTTVVESPKSLIMSNRTVILGPCWVQWAVLMFKISSQERVQVSKAQNTRDWTTGMETEIWKRQTCLHASGSQSAVPASGETKYGRALFQQQSR